MPPLAHMENEIRSAMRTVIPLCERPRRRQDWCFNSALVATGRDGPADPVQLVRFARAPA